MISAVAARKAALAAQNQQISAEETLPSGSGSTSPRKEPHKRKSFSQKQTSHPETKKPRKSKPFEKSNDRRVDVDAFKEQTDMIVVDLESEDGSDDAMSSILEGSDHEPLPQPTEKRPWSPSLPMEDSSDEDSPEDNFDPLDISTLFPHLSRPRHAPQDGALSTFQPVFDHNMFYLTKEDLSSLGLSGNGTLVCLKDEDSLCLLGTCILTVLHGSINICGISLSSSSKGHPIYAPRSSPLPIITTGLVSGSALHLECIPSRLRNILNFKAVIALQELRTGVDGLGRVCRTFEGVFEPSRWQKASTDAPFRIPGLYLVNQMTKDLYPFSIPSSWSNALDLVSNRSVNALCGMYIVKGPKNSGKSAFARTLTNHLLGSYRRVAFLECDIGQSEFSPGGMVSLNIISDHIFGPPFTHPTLPNQAHFIGSTTPRSSPSHYLDAIAALIQTYRLDIQSPANDIDDDSDDRITEWIPLVVNTMGWSKGLGADLTQKIENILEPTDIFDIQAPVREQFPVSIQPMPVRLQSPVTMDSTTAQVHVLDPIAPSPVAGYTAADHRTMSILSYFHAQFPFDAVPSELGQLTAKSWDTTRPLSAILPYEVDCRIALDKVVLVGAGSEDVVEEEIARVLNGGIVGLVSCDPGTIGATESAAAAGSSAGIPYTRHHAPPSPSSSTCVGLALVRGISPPANTPTTTTTYLHILTPLPHAFLARSRVIVKGEMELPIWGMLDFRNFNEGKDDATDKVPFLQWGKAPEGVMGAEKRKVRRNLMRRGHN